MVVGHMAFDLIGEAMSEGVVLVGWSSWFCLLSGSLDINLLVVQLQGRGLCCRGVVAVGGSVALVLGGLVCLVVAVGVGRLLVLGRRALVCVCEG